MPEPIRVLIVDDHALFRAGLRKLLEAEPGFTVIGETGSGSGAAELTERLQPDIVLLDLALPGLNGLEVLREMAAASTRARIVMLTAAIAPADAVQAIHLGAAGVLMKTAATELLYKCIRSVMNGQYWIGRDAIRSLIGALAATRGGPHAPERPFGLTPRELEVARLVAQGCSNREVGAQLNISEDTVKHHLSKAFDKTGASSRVELAIFMDHHDPGTRHASS